MSRERSEPLLLALLAAALFAWLAPRAGLHLDDYGFWADFEGSGPAKLLRLTLDYVPGRNLYIPLFYGLHRLCGGSPALMHLAGAALDALNPILLFALARRLGAGRGVALAAAGLFLAWPNHGETHWWTSSIVMNGLSTTLALAAALAAADGRLKTSAALFAVALFDYDQVYLLWLPLLALARAKGLPWRRLTPYALLFAGLNAAHLALRLLAPVAGGGRPTPQAGLVLRSGLKALAMTFAPMRRNPSFDAVALVLALGLGALWAWRCAKRWERDPSAEAPLAAFGAAWWALAYAPNLLWYISPRHNLLPSVGSSLAAAALASRLSASPAARRPLAAAGAALFALFTLCAWSDGTAWAESAQLHRRFAAAVAADRSAPVVVLLNAPRELRGAPAFSGPADALGALRFAGLNPFAADLNLAPDRQGAFYGGQRDLFGEQAQPAYADLRGLVVYDFAAGRFERVKALLMSPPATLTASTTAGRGVPAEAGPALESAALRPSGPGSSELELVWRAGKQPREFAYHLRLLDASGRELWAAVTPETSTSRPAFFPVRDDRRPSDEWKPGERVRHVLSILYAGPAAAAKVTLFERREGPWARLGTREVKL